MGNVVAITGVTGDVGGKTLELLRAMDVPVRAIVRREHQADGLAERGIDARVADLGDREALAWALRDVDQLFLVTAATQQQFEHGANAVHAAQDAGVRALVHLSGADVAEDSPMPWAKAICDIDVLVRASGLSWTLLHPSGFMTNLLSSAPAIRRGLFPQTMGRGRIAWIDTADIARTAAHVLRAGEHHGEEPILTGPELLDGPAVAHALSAGLDRRVRYLHLPSRVFQLLLRSQGVPGWKAEGLRQQFARVARNGLDNIDVVTGNVERLSGQPPTSLTEWSRSQRAALLEE